MDHGANESINQKTNFPVFSWTNTDPRNHSAYTTGLQVYIVIQCLPVIIILQV